MSQNHKAGQKGTLRRQNTMAGQNDDDNMVAHMDTTSFIFCIGLSVSEGSGMENKTELSEESKRLVGNCVAIGAFIMLERLDSTIQCYKMTKH